jgi:hypothetical protein
LQIIYIHKVMLSVNLLNKRNRSCAVGKGMFYNSGWDSYIGLHLYEQCVIVHALYLWKWLNSWSRKWIVFRLKWCGYISRRLWSVTWWTDTFGSLFVLLPHTSKIARAHTF